VATIVAVYIFKSARVTAITNVILGVCVVWILGLMALLEIPLNSTTALAFGFVPITTIEIVIHMVVRYHIYHRSMPDKAGAVKQTVRWLARPSFICSATTAVGFGTLMVSSIPMVRQLGFIMSLGIMVSYALAFILTPAFLMYMKSLDRPEKTVSVPDWLDSVLISGEKAIFKHHRVFVIFGIGLTLVLFAGTPFIRSDIQLLRMLSDSTPEVQDVKFVEQNLTSATSLELMLEGEAGAFRRPETWKRVMALEKKLLEIPEVVGTDSFLPLMEYLNGTIDPTADSTDDLFAKPTLIPQILVMTSLNPEGQKMRKRFLDEGLDRLRISVRIKNSPSVPLGETIERVQSTADSIMGGVAEAAVTGDLAVLEKQTSRLVRDQVVSMALAVVVITVLMMIQLGSPTLGLICLIPNIPPVAAVFGIMGWFGISLDAVTVFAATVVIGLAVDNTIHFLTQLKREIKVVEGRDIDTCVRSAYRLTAKQIASWTAVTLLGFLALAASPFRPVVLFGVLGCSALLLGMFGDLIFIQSLILTSPAIRRSISRLIEREMLAER
jgi:predicted RND superfamily exporter protein